METLKHLLDILLHLNKYLADWSNEYGVLIYGILFLIVFTETGLVFMPLLPGDSLLFAAGALCATQANGDPAALNILYVIPLLIVAALLGDNTNYFVGKFLGDIIQKKERVLFLKKEYIVRTEAYFEKHGGKTIIMARFIPIVRTIAPFVAGAGEMNYRRYLTFCIVGALLWVTGLTTIGYLFGQNAWVQAHFETVIFAIIGISVLPVVFAAIKSKFSKA